MLRPSYKNLISMLNTVLSETLSLGTNAKFYFFTQISSVVFGNTCYFLAGVW